MMTDDKPTEKVGPDPDDKPDQVKMPPPRGKTFGGRGNEKRG